METLINDPLDERRGVAFIAHPHPLHGGTMNNKVVQTVAQVAYRLGIVTVRPNFRGVGQSDGRFDNGVGETLDMMEIIQFVMGHYENLPIFLAGFSFGAYVQHRVARSLADARLLLIAPAVNLYAFEPVSPNTLLIHGDQDELVPLAEVRRYAEASGATLMAIAGADHFFHAKLKELALIVQNAWRC
ncbi:MAG: alpha/beta hydrolase [Thiobacillaceae bacterium]